MIGSNHLKLTICKTNLIKFDIKISIAEIGRTTKNKTYQS